MNSSHHPTWMPLAVLSLCVLGTLALAQPPGFPRSGPGAPGFGSTGPPSGFGQPRVPGPPSGFGSPSTTPPGPPAGFGQPMNPGAQPPRFGQPEDPVGGTNPPDARNRMPRMNGVGATPNVPMPNVPEMVMQSQGTCSKCNRMVTWTGNTAPSSCPHCGTKFGYVENADGTKTYTSSGRASQIGKIVVGVIVALSLLGAMIGGIVRAASGSGKKKVKKRKKPLRRQRDDDDY